MKAFRINSDNSVELFVEGDMILQNSLINKGTAFTMDERARLKLHGLLPPYSKTLKEQEEHCYQEYLKKKTPLGKHLYLRSLQDRNETLFYYLLRNHIAEMLEIIYTPTVGMACQKFYEIYRRPRGLFVSYPNRGRIDEILNNCSLPDVKAIVVTDGGRILGLGDLGAGGMGISIGKIALYTACGGLNPAYGLPIVLDVGTNNEDLLQDPFYLGWKHERLEGDEYFSFIDQFVQAIKRKFPRVLLQWEDFAKHNAHVILDRYRESLCTFNDDIQGTAAVTLAGIIAGAKSKGEALADQRYVIVGAGSSGRGIAELLIKAMKIPEEEALAKIWMLNSKGVFNQHNPDPEGRFQRECDFNTLRDCVKNVMPTVLIGVSAQPGIFTKEIVVEMAKHCPCPIILPLSNPDTKCEAVPHDLVYWTRGKAIIATGTKFPNVEYKGKVHQIGQNNNHYIFPSIALGVFASQAEYISDEMFLAAAYKLSEFSPVLHDTTYSLFPEPEKIPHISKQIAVCVAQHAGLLEDQALLRVQHAYWEPHYPLFISKHHCSISDKQ